MLRGRTSPGLALKLIESSSLISIKDIQIYGTGVCKDK